MSSFYRKDGVLGEYPLCSAEKWLVFPWDGYYHLANYKENVCGQGGSCPIMILPQECGYVELEEASWTIKSSTLHLQTVIN